MQASSMLFLNQSEREISSLQKIPRNNRNDRFYRRIFLGVAILSAIAIIAFKLYKEANQYLDYSFIRQAPITRLGPFQLQAETVVTSGISVCSAASCAITILCVWGLIENTFLPNLKADALVTLGHLQQLSRQLMNKNEPLVATCDQAEIVSLKFSGWQAFLTASAAISNTSHHRFFLKLDQLRWKDREASDYVSLAKDVLVEFYQWQIEVIEFHRKELGLSFISPAQNSFRLA